MSAIVASVVAAAGLWMLIPEESPSRAASPMSIDSEPEAPVAQTDEAQGEQRTEPQAEQPQEQIATTSDSSSDSADRPGEGGAKPANPHKGPGNNAGNRQHPPQSDRNNGEKD